MGVNSSRALRWLRAAAGVGLIGSLFGCGSSAGTSDDSPMGTAGAPPTNAATDVVFDSRAMTVAPGESRSVVVHINPAGTYAVRFALLGESGDASLDRTDILSDPDGTAEVKLTAPTEPLESSFRIRASVGTALAVEAEVMVSAKGKSSLEVTPDYSGNREISFWVASARPGTTCAQLTGTPPPDGEITAESSVSYSPLLEVPTGRNLAVTIRSESKVSGCVDVSPLSANEARTVEVNVSDVPLRLDGVDLELSLDLSNPEPNWGTLVDATLDTFDAAVLGESNDDIDVLLDAMSEATSRTESHSNLELPRAAGGWDGALASLFDDTDYSALIRAQVRTWFEQGAGQLDNAAPLTATLVPVDGVAGWAYLYPATLASLPASSMGLPEEALVSWKSEPNDKVLLGASFAWFPWQAFTRLAELQTQLGDESTIPDALVTSLDCPVIATELYNRASSDMEYCDVDCLETACAVALHDIWSRASEKVLATESARLDLSATATVHVDEKAKPLGFVGQWVGTIDMGTHLAQASGAAEGWIPLETSDAEAQ